MWNMFLRIKENPVRVITEEEKRKVIQDYLNAKKRMEEHDKQQEEREKEYSETLNKFAYGDKAKTIEDDHFYRNVVFTITDIDIDQGHNSITVQCLYTDAEGEAAYKWFEAKVLEKIVDL